MLRWGRCFAGPTVEELKDAGERLGAACAAAEEQVSARRPPIFAARGKNAVEPSPSVVAQAMLATAEVETEADGAPTAKL